jgi:hypothetical protein
MCLTTDNLQEKKARDANNSKLERRKIGEEVLCETWRQCNTRAKRGSGSTQAPDAATPLEK